MFDIEIIKINCIDEYFSFCLETLFCQLHQVLWNKQTDNNLNIKNNTFDNDIYGENIFHRT